MTTVEPTPLHDAVDAAFAAPVALLALGIPLCPSCELLKVTLAEIARSRPALTVVLASMDSPDDWAARETLLWPRGISVSRASIPAMVLVQGGEVVASRQGGGPASVLDRWIAATLGPAAHPVADGISATETDALGDLAAARAHLLATKAARAGLS